jgi:predicted nucleic acid-binding protein
VSHLLDTNVVSELRKRPGVVDPGVLTWAEERPVHELFISVVTVMEIELGILRVERRDPGRGAVLRRWFEGGVLVGFTGRVLPVELGVARRAARLHVPDPRPERDAYIAATALEHGLTVATRNVADFEPTGVALVNPWAL